MAEPEIIDDLQRAFAEAFLDLDSPLERSLTFEDITGLDSISRVRLMLSVEDVFTVEISPRENGKLRTIGDLIDLIQAKQAGTHYD
jgi:acyl carrier protein